MFAEGLGQGNPVVHAGPARADAPDLPGEPVQDVRPGRVGHAAQQLDDLPGRAAPRPQEVQQGPVDQRGTGGSGPDVDDFIEGSQRRDAAVERGLEQPQFRQLRMSRQIVARELGSDRSGQDRRGNLGRLGSQAFEEPAENGRVFEKDRD